MKLLIRDVVFLYDTINKIAEKENIGNAPIDVKFLLVRNARELQPIWAEFMNTRNEVTLANSESVDDNSEQRSMTPEQLDYVNNEIAKLGETEVEVAITPISLSKLETLNLDIMEINGLYPIIKNEEAY